MEILVRKDELAAAEEAMARAGGFVGMDPTSPDDYAPIAEIEIPGAPAYRLIGFDPGADYFGVTPDDALVRIRERGRSPLTIEEGIAVLLQHPAVLKTENAFSLLASRRGDRRVPALWMSGGRPRLGWCWAGATHSWLGAASCSERAETD